MSAPGDRARWVKAYLGAIGGGIHALTDLMGEIHRDALTRAQVKKPLHKVTKTEGPMLYIGQQIVKKMEKSGYPAKVIEHWRTPERQAMLKARGNSKAGPWQSPHQFGEAVDIVHKTRAWDVTPDFWENLAICVRVVEAELNVRLEHGHKWHFVDSAHVELKDWRDVRNAQITAKGHNWVPTQSELQDRWRLILPSVPMV